MGQTGNANPKCKNLTVMKTYVRMLGYNEVTTKKKSHDTKYWDQYNIELWKWIVVQKVGEKKQRGVINKDTSIHLGVKSTENRMCSSLLQ